MNIRHFIDDTALDDIRNLRDIYGVYIGGVQVSDVAN